MNAIVCVQIPHLAVAAARRDAPELVGRPLVLYTAERGRAVVYAADQESGVQPGLPLRHAALRCPAAAFLPAEPSRDRAAFAALVALLESFSPRVAPGAPLPHAIAWCDLGRQTAAELRAVTSRLAASVWAELRLATALGAAANPLVARIAAGQAGAGAAIIVPPGGEARFLEPLPLAVLPLDPEIGERLEALGLRTVGSVARLPRDALEARFGAAGGALHDLAHGRAPLPLVAAHPPPQVRVGCRFGGPVQHRPALELALGRLAATLSGRLREGGWMARELVLTLALDDGPPLALRRALAEATSDARLLAAALGGILRAAPIGSGVIRAEVAADCAPAGARQLDLFAPEGGRKGQLEETLQRLAPRFAGSFLRARLAEPAARRPERRVRFEVRECVAAHRGAPPRQDTKRLREG